MNRQLFTLSFIALFLTGCRETSPPSPSTMLFAEPLIVKTLEKVRQEYVEAPDEKKMLDGALNGMLMALDPYSAFLDPESFKIFINGTKGEFGGLGMEIFFGDGVLKVIAPMDDTPASRAGIKAGDTITHINGIPLNGLAPEETLKQLHGQPGTSVTLKIHRPPALPFSVKIIRALIVVNPVKYRIEGNIGYVRISYFNEQTTQKLTEAIIAITKSLPATLRGLVLDLRNNPGGTLEQAVNVSSLFLTSGTIVQVKGRKPENTKVFMAKGGGRKNLDIKGIPIAILINKGSASASEIVAAALRDNHRAVLVGEKTFGKGSVQALYPLENYGGIRMTIARFYTPNGEEIQGKGIQPDIALPLKAAEAQPEPPKDKDAADEQLQRALDVLQGLWAVKLRP